VDAYERYGDGTNDRPQDEKASHHSRAARRSRNGGGPAH
jgi:hypothetical protein